MGLGNGPEVIPCHMDPFWINADNFFATKCFAPCPRPGPGRTRCGPVLDQVLVLVLNQVKVLVLGQVQLLDGS